MGITYEAQLLRLGTRGSALALYQARYALALLQTARPDLAVRIEIIQSLGDLVPDQPLAALGAQGIFTHALESALLRGDVDVAVHSAKDLPSSLGAGLVIAAVPSRADPHDCLVTRDGRPLNELPEGARIGTGSPRRAAQLRAARPDLCFEPLRGNVDTRRRAALDGRLDGVVLAVAGLARLGLLDEHVAVLPIEICLPQAGQGALALETRTEDERTRNALEGVHDSTASACLTAERAVLAGLAAGCQAPVAAFAESHQPGSLRVKGLVAGLEYEKIVTAVAEGDMEQADHLGHAVARDLQRSGADRLLRHAREDRT